MSCASKKKKFTHSDSLMVSSVDDFSSLSGNLGQQIQTKGFLRNNKIGAAEYIVRQHSKPNGRTVFRLKNNLSAVLVGSKDSIVLDQIGLLPNSENHRAIFSFAVNNSKKIIIPEGHYTFNGSVDLGDLTEIEGRGQVRIKGGFVLNDFSDVKISNIEFTSWKVGLVNSIRVGKQNAGLLSVSNCRFNNGNIYQQLPLSRSRKSEVRISQCSFECQGNAESRKLNTIQLHSDNVVVKNSIFQINKIEGCIKLATGRGESSIKGNTFRGGTIEEIVDFYTYKGHVDFINNDVSMSGGGVIKSKPGGLKQLADYSYSCTIKDNVIKSMGSQKQILYISGTNLIGQNKSIKQEVKILNNDIYSVNPTTLINVRGIHEVLIKNNSLSSKISKAGSYMVNIAAISNLEMVNNSFVNGGVLGFQGVTTNGEKYSRDLSECTWNISNNRFKNNSLKSKLLAVQGVANLNLVMNENEIEVADENNAIQFKNGSLRAFQLNGNKLNAQPLSKSRFSGKNFSIDPK